MSLSNKLSITDVDLKGKRVLIRVGLLSAIHLIPFSLETVFLSGKAFVCLGERIMTDEFMSSPREALLFGL